MVNDLRNKNMPKIKKDGTYDKRNTDGRQATGKPLHPKATEDKMKKALKNKRKAGK